MARTRHKEFNSDHLVEALDQTKGFIMAAQKYIKTKFGYHVDYKTIKTKIVEWDLSEWLDGLRKKMVEDCLKRTFYKGIEKGDNACLFWVLDRFSHHIDFLDAKNTETASMKGWKELLEYVKEDTEPNSAEKSS